MLAMVITLYMKHTFMITVIKSLASTAGISDAIIIFLYKAWVSSLWQRKKYIAIYCTIKYHQRCLRTTLYNLH